MVCSKLGCGEKLYTEVRASCHKFQNPAEAESIAPTSDSDATQVAPVPQTARCTVIDGQSELACKAWCIPVASEQHCPYCNCQLCDFCAATAPLVVATPAATAVIVSPPPYIYPSPQVASPPPLPVAASPPPPLSLPPPPPSGCALLEGRRSETFDDGVMRFCSHFKSDPDNCHSHYVTFPNGSHALCSFTAHSTGASCKAAYPAFECTSSNVLASPPPLQVPKCASALYGLVNGRTAVPPIAWCMDLSGDPPKCVQYYMSAEKAGSPRRPCVFRDGLCKMGEPVQCED